MVDINPCAACGGKVRLRVMKISFNRRRGIGQWFEHAEPTTCQATNKWAWDQFKPYQKNPSMFEQKAAEWNERQRLLKGVAK